MKGEQANGLTRSVSPDGHEGEDLESSIEPGSPPAHFSDGSRKKEAKSTQKPELVEAAEQMMQLSLHSHSGPWPSPSTLREYKEISPELFQKVLGFSEAALDAALVAQKKQIELQERDIEYEHEVRLKQLSLQERHLAFQEERLKLKEREQDALLNVKADNSDHALRGQIIAAVMMLLFFGAILFLAHISAAWVAYIAVTLPFGGVIGIIALRQSWSGKSTEALAQMAIAAAQISQARTNKGVLPPGEEQEHTKEAPEKPS